MHDIVVIGGGPAGCRSAALLSKDFDVRIIEEHPASGSPVQCTGLVSGDVVKLSGVRPEILNTLSKASFEFPNGKEIDVGSKSDAFLIDRGDFDRKMAQAAIDAGAKISYSRRYISHSLSDGCVDIETTEGKMRSILLIGADGPVSKVASSLGNNEPREFIRGIQYDIRYRMADQDTVKISIGNGVAPGFFAWMVPFGEYTRVGLCTDWCRGPPMEHFRRFLVKKGLDDCEIVAKSSGRIPLGGRRRIYGDNVLLIGDSTAYVKPLSGGGLFPAFVAAPLLESTVRKAMDKGDFSAKMLSSYETMWKDSIGKKLDRSYKMRNYYHKLTDDEFNFIHGKMSAEKYAHLFEHADMDDPTPIVKSALKDIPLMFSALPLVFRVKVRK